MVPKIKKAPSMTKRKSTADHGILDMITGMASHRRESLTYNISEDDIIVPEDNDEGEEEEADWL